jgi:FkbM family methyltransferase
MNLLRIVLQLIRVFRKYGLKSTALTCYTLASGSDSISFILHGKKYYINRDTATFSYLLESIQKIDNMVKNVKLNNEKPVVFDVGSNCGLFSALLKDKYPSSTVYMFEPSFRLHKIIKRNMEYYDSWYLFDYAVSDASSESVEFYENYDNLQTSSLFNDAVLPFYHKNIRTRRVKAITIDDFCTMKGIKRIDLLKVDIQGAEYFLLKGMSSMLKNTDQAIFEISFLDQEIISSMNILSRYFPYHKAINPVYYGADIYCSKIEI